jgi:hypothetical protein
LLRYGRKYDGAWSDVDIVGEDGDLPDDGDAPVLARAYEYQQQRDWLLEALEAVKHDWEIRTDLPFGYKTYKIVCETIFKVKEAEK